MRYRFGIHHLLQFNNRTVELRIFSGDLILRRIVDLDIGVNAVILNAPSSAGIPPRKLGLRTAAVIDEVLVAADSDHATPCALADQWS